MVMYLNCKLSSNREGTEKVEKKKKRRRKRKLKGKTMVWGYSPVAKSSICAVLLFNP